MLRKPRFKESYAEHLKRYMDRVLREGKVVGILFYGSLSRSMEKPFPESDIDIIVIARGLPKDLYERRIWALKFKENAETVEDLWMEPEELMEGVDGGWGLILDALTQGKPLYDPEKLLEKAKEKVLRKYRRIGKIWVLGKPSSSR